MITRTLSGTIGTELDARGPGWNSRRLKAGLEQKLWYEHLLETRYRIEGAGFISDRANGVTR